MKRNIKIIKAFNLLIILCIFFSCTGNKKNDTTENSESIVEAQGQSIEIQKETKQIRQIIDNGVTGSVWIAQIHSGQSNNKNISLAFLNEYIVQILEWETTVSEHNHQYEYELFDNENILHIYSYYNARDINYDHYPLEIRKEYTAIIEENTMIFTEWFNGENIVFAKREDLSGIEDIIIIKDTYYENSEYFIIIECKLLSNHSADVWLSISQDQSTISYSITVQRYSDYAGVLKGYNMIIISFSENQVKEKEENITTRLIFEYPDGYPGGYPNKYLNNNLPSLSNIQATIKYGNDYFARSERIKFR